MDDARSGNPCIMPWCQVLSASDVRDAPSAVREPQVLTRSIFDQMALGSGVGHEAGGQGTRNLHPQAHLPPCPRR